MFYLKLQAIEYNKKYFVSWKHLQVIWNKSAEEKFSNQTAYGPNNLWSYK